MTQAASTDLSTAAHRGPLLIAMLPARNAEADLPGYLDNASSFCDLIVALDDGSTDGTHDILASHPMVKTLLRNPRREDYREWDDAANRNRLLAAASEFDPAWLISLDADERLDERDAESLRAFLQTDALPGFAYGLRHVPMREDAEHFLPMYLWAYRLFSAAPGQRFRNQKLHFVPVPTTIPRSRWIKTTLRIQHFGELTSERRLVRFSKYLEADPRRRYQEDYAQVLSAPSDESLRRWLPRPESVPVLLGSVTHDDRTALAEPEVSEVPGISAIIVDQGNEASLVRVISSVLGQEVPGGLEVLVVTCSGSATASVVRERFPSVIVIERPGPALPGDARNAGLVVARGRWVTFPSPDTELLPCSLAARLDAHRRGYALVSGVAVNGTLSPAGWASYFLDRADALPGQPPAEVNKPLADCSYARLPLVEVGGFPEGVRTGEEIATNESLMDRGYVTYRDPGVGYIRYNPHTTPARMLAHQFDQGRGWGRAVLAGFRDHGQMLRRDLVDALLWQAVPMRLQDIDASVATAREDIRAEYRRYRSLVVLGAVASLAGTWWEILRPGPGKASILWGQPVLNVLLAGRDGFALAQLDAISGETTVRPVPRDLDIPHGTTLVPLADVVPIGTTGRGSSSLAVVRQIVGTALDVDRLECIVDPHLQLPPRSSGATATASTPSTRAGRIRGLVRAMWSTRRRTVRSTLGPWATARVLSRVGEVR